MKILAIAVLLLFTMVGCQSKPAGKTPAVAAEAPRVIKELTNQTTIYECPACQMDYDGPGRCSMCDVELVQTKVDYICPADNQPVEHAGKCPRCEVNAKVVKTAMTPSTSGASGGN